MRILVTGATGFIGTHLVFSLLECGHKVAVMKRKKSELKGLVTIQDRIDVFASDTYNDIHTGIGIFSPDVVIHLATLYINQHKPEHIVELVNSNIVFGTHILEAILANKAVKFLNVGTRWQHMKGKRYNPVNLYSATKEAFKDILIYYGTRGIEYKILELGDTYGFGDTRKKIMELLVTACQKKKKLNLTPGEQVLDLSYVGDICQFILSGIQYNSFFDNKTVSLSGTVIKLRDLGTLIEDRFKTSGFLRWGVKPYGEHEVMTPPGYYKKIQLNRKSLNTYLENIGDSV
jgi:nucleoside-diphosphate-sugar epimerase